MKPLERRVVLVSLLVQSRHGRSPSWTELKRLCGTRGKPFSVLEPMRKRGWLRWEEDRPGSLRVTEHGRRIALAKDGD